MDLVISHVYKDFGRGPVLRDVSLTVRQGETVCLMGPSAQRSGVPVSPRAPMEEVYAAAVRAGEGVGIGSIKNLNQHGSALSYLREAVIARY